MMLARLARFLAGTFRGRLVLSVAAVHAVMMTLFVADLTVRQRDMLLDRQVEEAAALSQALAISAAGWIAADDIAGLQELVEAQRRHPEILYALLADQDGRVLADLDPSRLGRYVTDLPRDPQQATYSRTTDLVDIAVPALVGGHLVGWARIGLGQKAAGEKLAAITRNGVLYSLAAIALGSAIAWFIGLRATRRLDAVQRTFEAVRSGDQRARSRLVGNDEAAMLARDFNAMLDALADRDRELHASERNFRSLIDKVQAAIVLHDGQGRILDSNPMAQSLLGLTADQLLGSALIDPHWRFLREDGSVMPVEEYPAARVLSTRLPLRGVVAGIAVPGRDGETWVLVNAEPQRDDAGEISLVIVSFVDITARRRTEQALQRLNRELRALSDCNEMLMRAEDEQALLDEICRIICRVADYPLAWVDIAEGDEEPLLRTVAWAATSDHASRLGLSLLDMVAEPTPATLAVARSATVCIEDFREATEATPWSALAQEYGYRSAIALPVRGTEKRILAVLNIFAATPAAFPPHEVRLLEELSGDLGFGLEVLRTRSQRRQAEAALRDSEQRYRTVFENSPVSVWEEDFSGVKILLDGLRAEGITDIEAHFAEHPEVVQHCAELARVVDVNAAALALHGADSKEALLAGLVHTFTPESFDTFRRELVVLWQGGTAMASEAMVKTLAGDARNVAIYFAVCPGYEVTLARVIVSLVDITERKQAERQRVDHLHFLETMDRVNRAIAASGDLDGAMNQVLDTVLDAFGCDRAFLLFPCDPAAATWDVPLERTRPQYPGVLALGHAMPMDESVAATMSLLLATDRPVTFGPGTQHPLAAEIPDSYGIESIMAMAIRPRSGKAWEFGIHQCSGPRNWTGPEQQLFQEIGRRLADGLTTLLAQRDLLDSRTKLLESQRIAHIGYWDCDIAAGRVTLAEESCRVLGLPTQQLSFGSERWQAIWRALIHPEDRERVLLAHEMALRGTAPFNVEYRVIFPDGDVRHIHSEALVDRDLAGQPLRLLGMMQDVSERKRAEAEVLNLNRQLEARVVERTAQLQAANKELESFAYSVSHDLRAPLRHIDGFLAMLEEHIGPALDEQGRHYVDTISAAARRMGTLIDDLLSFSRMGRQHMAASRVELEALIREVIAEAEPETHGRPIQWRIGALPTVTGDRAMLRIVLVNLISNALKFTATRPQAVIEAGCVAGAPAEDVVFVRDNGVGFDMRYRDKLFGVFQRLHANNEFEGTGIGLANVQRIIERHGGRVWAEGKVGAGATFFFSLPHSSVPGESGAERPTSQ